MIISSSMPGSPVAGGPGFMPVLAVLLAALEPPCEKFGTFNAGGGFDCGLEVSRALVGELLSWQPGVWFLWYFRPLRFL